MYSGGTTRAGNAMFLTVHRGEPSLKLKYLGASEEKEHITINHFHEVTLFQFSVTFARRKGAAFGFWPAIESERFGRVKALMVADTRHFQGGDATTNTG